LTTKKKPLQDAGYYVEHFTRAELADLDQALGESLRGEIGMLRVVMRRFFTRCADEADDLKMMANTLQVLGLSCGRLAKLLQTERGLQDTRAYELGEALSRSMAAVLDELNQTSLNGNAEGGQLGG